jgi:hypothetical protein
MVTASVTHGHSLPYPRLQAQPFLSLIGRGSARAERSSVDLNKVLARWHGGGHPAAAAASVKLRGPEAGDSDAAAEVNSPLLDGSTHSARSTHSGYSHATY